MEKIISCCGVICSDCCINQNKFLHCGKYELLPCEFYKSEDPTKSPEENAEDHRKQLEQLVRLK